MKLSDLTAIIRDYERRLAPGSETTLWGEYCLAMRVIESDEIVDVAADWWLGAYRALAWVLGLRYLPQEETERLWEQLRDAADFAGWEPPPVTPERLRAWRTHEDLTQARAATLGGVSLRHWQRWEAGTTPLPQWLPEVLAQRWGNAP